MPLVISLFCIPVLIKQLGTDQFGVLALGWAIIGYFGLFDMGLGRALAKLVAEKLGQQDYTGIRPLVWTGLAMMAALGVVAAIIVWAGAAFAVDHVLSVSASLKQNTITVIYLLALTIPFVILSAGITGVLNAYQRFDLIMKVRLPLGSWMFIGPLIAVLVFHTLVSVIVMLVLGRIAMLVVISWMCIRAVPELRRPLFDRHVVKPLFSFGGWVTVSNIISPFMDYMDRFVIAAILGMTAVTYYATPYTVAVKTQILSAVVLTVLFPALSTMLAFDRQKARRVFDFSNTAIFSLMFPIALLVVAFGQYGLEFWLGSSFASHSTLVLQLLIVGIMINSLASVPYALIQADGKPRITALLHLVELPIYFVVLWFTLHAWGIVGAAVAWTARVSLDWLLLLWIGSSRVKSQNAVKLVMLVIGLLLLLAGVASTRQPGIRIVECAALLFVVAIVVWRLFLSAEDRGRVRYHLCSIMHVA